MKCRQKHDIWKFKLKQSVTFKILKWYGSSQQATNKYNKIVALNQEQNMINLLLQISTSFDLYINNISIQNENIVSRKIKQT